MPESSRGQVELGVVHLVRTQNFPKTNISYPLIRTRMRIGGGGGKKCYFFVIFCVRTK